MPRRARHPTTGRMTEVTTYAVTWQDGDARFVGHAEVGGADELRLEGRGAGGAESVSAVP